MLASVEFLGAHVKQFSSRVLKHDNLVQLVAQSADVVEIESDNMPFSHRTDVENILVDKTSGPRPGQAQAILRQELLKYQNDREEVNEISTLNPSVLRAEFDDNNNINKNDDEVLNHQAIDVQIQESVADEEAIIADESMV